MTYLVDIVATYEDQSTPHVEDGRTELHTHNPDVVTVSLPGEQNTSGADIPAFTCKFCGQAMDSADAAVLFDGDAWCTDNDESEEDEPPHVAESTPLFWANGAHIGFNREQDRLEVGISVDDPRGAFTLAIERKSDGTLIMFVPYEGMDSPHAKITQLHEGTFQIG